MSPIDDLNQRFVYVPDGVQHDDRPAWFVLTGKGEVRGDCEDYALTLAWLSCDRSWLRFLWAIARGHYQIWRAEFGGVGHALLKHDDLWADNIQKRWKEKLPSPPYEIQYRRSALVVFRKLLRSWWAR